MATLFQLGVLLLFFGKSQKQKLQNVYLLYVQEHKKWCLNILKTRMKLGNKTQHGPT